MVSVPILLGSAPSLGELALGCAFNMGCDKCNAREYARPARSMVHTRRAIPTAMLTNLLCVTDASGVVGI